MALVPSFGGKNKKEIKEKIKSDQILVRNTNERTNERTTQHASPDGPHLGYIWASPYGLAQMGPRWDPDGQAQIELYFFNQLMLLRQLYDFYLI